MDSHPKRAGTTGCSLKQEVVEIVKLQSFVDQLDSVGIAWPGPLTLNGVHWL